MRPGVKKEHRLRYIASALFFGVWAYLLVSLRFSGIDTGLFLLVPFCLGVYLFVTAEREWLAGKQSNGRDRE